MINKMFMYQRINSSESGTTKITSNLVTHEREFTYLSNVSDIDDETKILRERIQEAKIYFRDKLFQKKGEKNKEISEEKPKKQKKNITTDKILI